LAIGGASEIVGDEAVGLLEGAGAAELDLAHVGDVEEAGGGAHRLVLLLEPGVLHRHVPAGEIDHAAPELPVGGVEWSLTSHRRRPR